MDYLVPKQSNEESCGRDNDDTGVAGDVVVDCVEELGANDDVDRRPAYAGEDVKDGDDFHAPPAEEEAGKYHLAKAKDGAKGGEEADRGDAKEVDEENCEKCVDETELEDGDGEGADGETRYDHICC